MAIAIQPVTSSVFRTGYILPLTILLDLTGSVRKQMENGKTIYENEQDLLRIYDAQIRQTDLAPHVMVSIKALVNDTCLTLVHEKMLVDLDIDQLIREMPAPCGVTRLDQAVIESVNEGRETHVRLSNAGTYTYQHVLLLLTDGLCTDADGYEKPELMDEAFALVDAQQQSNKLCVIAAGLAAKDNDKINYHDKVMQVMERLCKYGRTSPVSVTSGSNIIELIRLLGATQKELTRQTPVVRPAAPAPAPAPVRAAATAVPVQAPAAAPQAAPARITKPVITARPLRDFPAMAMSNHA